MEENEWQAFILWNELNCVLSKFTRGSPNPPILRNYIGSINEVRLVGPNLT